MISTRVGYTGGDVPNATYRNHGTHAEAIEIVFDPAKISYRRLLEFFFQIHDPTTLNRQGNDVGASYRSAIFYTDDEQKKVAEDTIADVDASGVWPGKVVTEVDSGRRLLGGGARAPGLPRALSARLYLPLRAAEVGAPPARGVGALADRAGSAWGLARNQGGAAFQCPRQAPGLGPAQPGSHLRSWRRGRRPIAAAARWTSDRPGTGWPPFGQQ